MNLKKTVRNYIILAVGAFLSAKYMPCSDMELLPPG